MKRIAFCLLAAVVLASCGEDIVHRKYIPGATDTLVVIDTVTVTPCADCHHHRHCRRHR